MTVPSSGVVTQLLEKHGIAVFLLVAGGYVVTNSVINPMVETSRAFVTDIRNANEGLQKEVERVETENLSRWDRSFALHTEKRDMIRNLDDEIDEINRKLDSIRSDIANLRTLFIKPFPIGDKDGTPETYVPKASP